MKRTFSYRYLVYVASLVLPACVYAQSLITPTGTIKNVICNIISILALIDPILFFCAFVLFFWGLSKYILRSSGSEKEIQVGRNYMLWGILALFVLLSVQAFVSILTNEFFGIKPAIPQLPGSGSAGPGCTFKPDFSGTGIVTN